MPLITAEERVGTRLAGKYRLDRILGKGGMGVVFAGVHERLQRPVAVKFLHPQYSLDAEAVRRFFAEAQAAARLRQPNVVDVFDLDIDGDGTAFMVLELLEGEPLSARIARGPLTVHEMAECLLPVLAALEVAHRAGIVHRDLKPDNIFLARDLEGGLLPKVLDFGIAKLTDPAKPDQTKTGAVIGTPSYMAPEQAMADKNIGPWTDVWSIGTVAYECLSGRLPFEFRPDTSLTAALVMICTERPVPLRERAPDLPEEILTAIDAALQKEPSERLQSARALAEAIGDFVGSSSALSVGATATHVAKAETRTSTPFNWTSTHPGRSRSSRAPLIAIGIGAIVTLSALGSWVFDRGGGTSQPPADRAADSPSAVGTTDRVDLTAARLPGVQPSPRDAGRSTTADAGADANVGASSPRGRASRGTARGMSRTTTPIMMNEPTMEPPVPTMASMTSRSGVVLDTDDF